MPLRTNPEDSSLRRNPLPGQAFSSEALIKLKPKLQASGQVSADHARVRHFDDF